MNSKPLPFLVRFEQQLARLGFGMRAKLIVLFVVIKVLPLLLLAVIAWRQSWELGEDLKHRTREIAGKAVQALSQAGDIAVNDAVIALNERATEDIERMSTGAARRVADFLYARDSDVLFAATLAPEEDAYRHFVERMRGELIKQGAWVLAPDGASWVRADQPSPRPQMVSSNEENSHSFHYRPPEDFAFVSMPLYHEMTFVDLAGQETIKVATSPLMDPERKNVSDRHNTFVKAETYFAELKKLKAGEIYVSDVIGEYIGTNLIGMYTPANAAKRGVEYTPEGAAFAGMENPLGRRFNGIVRWATPVERDGTIIGYVTLALNHDHIMNFTDHIVPTKERYTEIPDAHAGNYAFIWDHKGRSIVHPRHHSIVGYDAASGDPQVPWLEDRLFNEWQASGLSYPDFIADVPTFFEQSNSKKPAPELGKKGLVGLDCRYLNFAPQCTGWFDLTEDGGSGSFRIFWSGLWKLNTAAAIPYYTGQYGKSLRGFGFVAVGAGVDDFYLPATQTQKVINKLISDTDEELDDISADTYRAISQNLWETAAGLSASTGLMAVLVILIALWMASAFTRSITRIIDGISRFRSGEWHFRFNALVKDELGTLTDSFDDMADSLVATLKGPVILLSLDRRVRYMNAEGLGLLGVTSLADVLGKSYSDISIFDDCPACNPISALLSGAEPDVLYHQATGRYYQGQAKYLSDKNGENIGYVVNISDVTNLLEEQKHIEEQRAILETVFSGSPDILWYQDSRGRYIVVNPRFASMVGKSPEEIRGKAREDLFTPEAAASFRANAQKAIEAGAPFYTEERMHFADGHEEIMDSVRTPLFNSQGEFLGLLGVARDVSQRVAVENELRQTQLELKIAAVEAKKASEAKSAFLARMSHEIRTPMNAIIGMTGIAKRKIASDATPKEEVLAHVRQIEISAQHLLGLLNDILDISKIEAGKLELSLGSFSLSDVASNVYSIISPRCLEKNIAFEMEFDPHLEESHFISDSLRLRQVLINLLGNAVKFTPELGTISFRIRRLGASGGKTLVGFSVSDSGIGIADEVLPTLFKPFEQGSASVTRLYGGTGLGLSISKNIIGMLGGDIQVVSREGEGSIFSFELWFEDDITVTEAKVAPGDTSSLRGKRMLLVDDVEINRMIVVEVLSQSGLLIEEAADGTEAVEKFKNSPEGYYDVIFMDVQMPHMDGYEATTAIRALERPDAKSVPIYAMTANAFKDDVDHAMDSGMNGHLAKPLEPEKMFETLSKALGKQ
ncbi:MAG: ATP-binding protein [Desulfovibrionaceae bacterium]|nr:ATP-binding protein [Desulfovibrionaceae bacterium]